MDVMKNDVDMLTEKWSIQEVLNIIQESKQIIKMIETMKIKFIGRIMRYNNLILNVTERKINEKSEKRSIERYNTWKPKERNYSIKL